MKLNNLLKDAKPETLLQMSANFIPLKEKRYRKFALPGFEARPVLVIEHVEKEGITGIEGYNPYGGGLRKGTHWEMDTAFLKRTQ